MVEIGGSVPEPKAPVCENTGIDNENTGKATRVRKTEKKVDETAIRLNVLRERLLRLKMNGKMGIIEDLDKIIALQ